MSDGRRPPSWPRLPGATPPPPGPADALDPDDPPTQRRPSQPELRAARHPSQPELRAARPPSQPELRAARRPTPAEGPATARRAPTTTPQEAALFDAVVVPRWSTLFGRILLARIPAGERAQVLDLGCSTGHPSYELMRKMGDGGRVIAIDRDPALVDLARRRALDQAGKRIFFKVEPVEHMTFGDEVFDLVIGNLVLGSVGSGGIDDEGAAYAEIRRVLMPGGRVLLTRPLAGTFEEVHDMFREIAVRRDLAALQRRIDHLGTRQPSAAAWRAQLAGAGFHDVDVTIEELKLPFRNAHELFADPMLRLVAMPEWRWLCGMEPGDEQLLAEAERALDTYFASGPLSLTVQAGLAEARKPG